MNKTVIIFIIHCLSNSILFSQTDIPNTKYVVYTSIVQNLEKNYILLQEEMSPVMFRKYFPMSDDFLISEIQSYEKTLKEISNLDLGFIYYLMKFEKDTDIYCDWIRRRNPSLSIIKKNDFLSKSDAAKILIDNYLVGNSESLIINDYVENLTFSRIRKFLKKNKELNILNLREKYKQMISRVPQ